MENNTRLLEQIGTEQLSHAYLFESVDPEFACETVDAFAARLFCREKIPCQTCPACVKICAGSHPDLIRVQPVKDTISIDAIRDMSRRLHLSPQEAEHKIVHIENAQYMRPAAQNALLKTLEEPPLYGIMILSLTNAKRILPTIRSRCRLVRLGGAVKPASIDRGMLDEVLTDAGNGNVDAAFRSVRFFQDYTDHKEELLQEIELYLRDLLIYKTTGEKALLTDRTLPERAMQNRMTPAHILRVLDLLIEVREGFRRNVNFQLSMERILIEMLEDKS